IPSAKRVTLFLITSTTPPVIFTCDRAPPARYSTVPPRRKLINGACPFSTLNNPSTPGNVTLDTSPSNTFVSGVRISKRILLGGFGYHLLAFFNGFFNVSHQVESHFGKFIHAQNGDNVLQFFIALQNMFHALSAFVMLFAHHVGSQNSRSRIQWIHGGINSQFGNFTAQYSGGV